MSKDLLIFCVEDDLDIQNLELYTLKANNYETKYIVAILLNLKLIVI